MDAQEGNSHQEQQPGDDTESTVTLNEVVQIENELFENATAVLGAGNDNQCTFPEGYVKRQALYSCLTCIPGAKTSPEKGAGVCLACSYLCHEGHELVELYTKRSFRCDCGNAKFTNGKCNLITSGKSGLNDNNLYNQNFGGIYCTCHRPYPDPEDSVSDEMVQCILCEDWYHSRHLGVDEPPPSFAEMICESCIKQHPFLASYDAKLTNVDVTSVPADEKSKQSMCKKPIVRADEKLTTVFFSDISWRQELCVCDDCTRMYDEQKIQFLVDPQDPVQLYEEKNKAKGLEMAENQQQNFFQSMDRVVLGELAAGYNDLRDNLKQFLQKFAENKKVVREEDVREFFEGMKSRKKQKVGGIQYHCH